MAVNKDDKFLDDAINSILYQTFADFEFIIVANNCEDVFFEKLLSYKEKDRRIHLYRTSIAQLPYNLNYGIDKSIGKYIVRMDADDISEKERFEKQVSFLDTHPEVDVLGSNFVRIDENDKIIPSSYVFYETHHDIQRKMRYKCCVCHPTVIFRKEKVLKVGGYAYGFTAEDYDLWLRMLDQSFIFHNMNEKLLRYRTHQNSATGSKKNLKRNIAYSTSLLFRKFVETKDVGYIVGMFIASGLGIRLVKLRGRFLRLFSHR